MEQSKADLQVRNKDWSYRFNLGSLIKKAKPISGADSFYATEKIDNRDVTLRMTPAE